MVLESDEGFQLREPGAFYKRHFDPKKDDMGAENGYFWTNNLEI